MESMPKSNGNEFRQQLENQVKRNKKLFLTTCLAFRQKPPNAIMWKLDLKETKKERDGKKLKRK